MATIALSGCNFEVAGIDVGVDAGVGDGAVVRDFAASVDLERSPDLRSFCDPAGGDDHCSSDDQSVLACRSDGSGFDTVMCSLGCGTQSGRARCLALEPSGVVQASDYATATATPTITSDVLINTDDGSITGGLTRAAGSGVVSGIFYRGTAKVGVFGFASLDVAPGVRVRARGASALGIVASKQITISGTLDLQDDCAAGIRSAGAGAGGVAGALMGGGAGGGGAGGTMPPNRSSGGGGGGFGDAGGRGGTSTLMGGAAGTIYGDLITEPVALVGGSGGGVGGGAGGPMAIGGNGGNGGGAVQIAVNGSLTIVGTIQAGGCGGRGGMGGSGGGGGAGGAILLEAVTIALGGGSALVANGGGGGGTGGFSANGGNGATSTTAAAGGSAGPGAGAGAVGGVAGSLAGHDAASTSSQPAGGGGGGVGRIALKTRDGTIQGQGGVLSPGLADQSSAGKAVTTVSTAAFE
jgi:hypothetical protein